VSPSFSCRKTGASAVLAALLATCGPTAPAVAGEPDPPRLVCRPATSVDVEGPACGGTSVVLQPCGGLLVPAADVLDGDEAAAELATCRAHRASEAQTAREQLAALEQALAAARDRGDAHAAELDRVRGQAPAEHWIWPRIVGVVLAAGVAVAAGVPCARGEAGWCAVSGAGVGLGVGLAL